MRFALKASLSTQPFRRFCFKLHNFIELNGLSSRERTMSKNHRKKTQQRAFTHETSQILRTVEVDQRIFRRRLVQLNNIQSDGVGRIQTVLGMNPSGASDWGSISALYDEFRVVGCRLTLVSRQQNSVTAGSNAVYVIFDNVDGVVLGGYAQASEFQNAHIIPAIWSNNTVARFKFSRPSAGLDNALAWSDTAAPSGSTGAIKLYADTLSNSTIYFFYQMEWAVECRGIR